MDTGGPFRRPIPLARSILWAPASGGPRPGDIPFPVFLSQAALTAIAEHVAALVRPGQGVLGFLLGDLCECPDTNVSYLVIDAALRLNQAIYSDRSRDVVTRLWERIDAQLEEQQAHLIGWYHTHPPLPLTLSEYDVETHEHYFAEPWQVALLMGTDAAAPTGAFFRAGAEAWDSTPLAFYELLDDDSLRPGGKKRSFVTWKNYRAYNPMVPQGTTGPRVPAVKPPAPQAPRALPKPEPEPEPEPPHPTAPPPAPPAPRGREERTHELQFLTTAEDFAAPPPPRVTPAPRPAPSRRAPPALPVPPPRPSRPPPPEPEAEAEPEVEPEVEPEAEPEAELEPSPALEEPEPAAEQGGPTVAWPEEFERQEEEQPEAEEPPPPPPPRKARRRRKRRRGLWLTLCLLVILAGAGGAYWWFRPEVPSLQVPPSVKELPSRLKALVSRVKDLPFLKPRPVASKPRPQLPPRPQRRVQAPVQPPPEARPQGPGPVASPSPFAKLDRRADSLTLAVRSFNDRATLFDRRQLPCPGLARALAIVEGRWVAYTAARRTAGVLDAAHAGHDQTLYAGVDAVERRFEKSGCERS